ncbi:putative hemerythrin hhe cation binding domain-containing protein [Phaeoacremonium minimum UCRPA7]|uniref:Putative hemerythrin hhe cation binding domain-containing protein n=1 Tax=Phaeoacremonium minimum (strain UCR-PA7) TaxID=1286976 RepID=R8BDN8_PHAM7|nr:putative hemerythrin hhe cation binding domain-containing protein [Phaeoacremonium minimum UCRPA7]EON97414.1 putative hemerythrin hhe cation binding domain-containing protein [Phaeoacremonium minimum UCRPA7]
MTTTKKWADGPFELISSSRLGYKPGEKVKPVHTIAEEMIIVHNLLLRGINSIYLQCINVERDPAVVPDFVSYAETWGKTVHEHHDAEETLVFPEMEELAGEPGLMEANVAQHKAFHDGVGTYQAYLADVGAGKEKYDGQRLKAIIDSFMPVLRQHLSDEIDSLMALEKYEEKTQWDKWFKGVMDKVLKKADGAEMKFTSGPFAFQCHDKSFEDGRFAYWPPLPWFVMLLLRWFAVPKHKTWWQFSPCDTYGKRRELPYADEKN